MNVSGGVVGAGGGCGVVVSGGVCLSQKDIGQQEETVGWVKNKYITINNRT